MNFPGRIIKWHCSSLAPSRRLFKRSSKCTIISCLNRITYASASQNPTFKLKAKISRFKKWNICKSSSTTRVTFKEDIKKLKYRDQNHHSYQGKLSLSNLLSIDKQHTGTWNMKAKKKYIWKKAGNWTDLIIYKAYHEFFQTQAKMRESTTVMLEGLHRSTKDYLYICNTRNFFRFSFCPVFHVNCWELCCSLFIINWEKKSLQECVN